jgi:hypothetical protein
MSWMPNVAVESYIRDSNKRPVDSTAWRQQTLTWMFSSRRVSLGGGGFHWQEVSGALRADWVQIGGRGRQFFGGVFCIRVGNEVVSGDRYWVREVFFFFNLVVKLGGA